MTTLFISDLHLDDHRPETTALLLQFLQHEAVRADALYILGDLFEFWLGDDVLSECAIAVATGLSALSVRGVPCYFQHGNRDFMIKDAYAKSAGMTLLPEEHVADLYGERVLLTHGDQLCTDDKRYQEIRKLVRNPVWQRDMLSKSPEERLRVALDARDASAEHKGNLRMHIMDVNPGEVIDAFERHGVHSMIHGHTHRPATHHLKVKGKDAQRIVLGDWYTQGSILRVHPGLYELGGL